MPSTRSCLAASFAIQIKYTVYIYNILYIQRGNLETINESFDKKNLIGNRHSHLRLVLLVL